jgi:hypothetical protein
MKTIKLALVLCFLSAVMHCFAQSQPEKSVRTPEERLKMQLNAINKECILNKEQSVKIEQILSHSQQQIQALREKKPAHRGDRLMEAKAIADKQNEEVKKVLTPEQFIKYTALIEKQKEKLREKIKERKAEANDGAE